MSFRFSLTCIPAAALRRMRDGEDGALTVFGLFLFLTIVAVSAVALDVSRLMSTHTKLQVAADTAAHAALYLRDSESHDAAVAGAIAAADREFAGTDMGTVIRPEDVVFGSWDADTRQFTVDPTSRSAVLVTAELNDDRNNAVESYLFRFIGFDRFNLAAQSVFETYRPMCLTEGFVADGVVDIQSNNLYKSGFCLHSNSYISLNSNNTFEPGSVVQMPNTNDLDAPASASSTNTGLDEALRSGSYRLRILHQLEDIITGLGNGDSSVLPDFISGTGVITLSGNGKFDASDFTPGRVHQYTCHSSNGKLTIDNNSVLNEVVLATNCKVQFSQGTQLDDVVIATTSTSDRSINAPNGLIAGRDDHCAAGGGVRLLTMGGMEFAADLSLYGAQLIAMGDIYFSANAQGIEGASMVAGGEISGTSNMEMAYCGAGMEDNYEAEYFRMRQ